MKKASLYRKLKHTQKNVRLIIVDHLISKNTFQKSCGRRRLSAREKQQCLQSLGLPHTVAAANKQSACMHCSQAGRRRKDDKCPSQTSLRCSNVACSVSLCKKNVSKPVMSWTTSQLLEDTSMFYCVRVHVFPSNLITKCLMKYSLYAILLHILYNVCMSFSYFSI